MVDEAAIHVGEVERAVRTGGGVDGMKPGVGAGEKIAAFGGALLLIWNPSELANVLAVAIIGFCIAPIFPAMMSRTSLRVGDHDAANTIGMQLTATGFGTAVIPGTMGVLARRVSLEIPRRSPHSIANI
jgi:hypothetical protein